MQQQISSSFLILNFIIMQTKNLDGINNKTNGGGGSAYVCNDLRYQ